ncbi:MAG TPA: response regulator [Candidatus Angelobacter sp.]|nr:response regulator [Candidatus Angelobacter sp.]
MPLTALVVDDSMLIRHTVCRFFEDRGFRVESATNGSEALEMLANLRPDVIVTDLQMPKMDGRELIRTLKSQDQTATIPVVVLARKTTTEDFEGRAGYVIMKDIDIIAQLSRALEVVLPGSVVR